MPFDALLLGGGCASAAVGAVAIRNRKSSCLEPIFRFLQPLDDEDEATLLYEDTVDFLEKNVPLFRKQLPKSDIPLVANRVTRRKLKPGDVLVKQGERREEFFLIREGLASVLVDGVEQAVLEAGDYWGDGGVVRDRPSAATVVAREREAPKKHESGQRGRGHTIVLSLSRTDFEDLGLQKKVLFPKRLAIYNGVQKGSMHRKSVKIKSASVSRSRSPRVSITPEEEEDIINAIFNNVNLQPILQVGKAELKEKLARRAEVIKVKAGEDVVKDGEYSQAIYVIKSGSVKVIASSKPQVSDERFNVALSKQEAALQEELLTVQNARGHCEEEGKWTAHTMMSPKDVRRVAKSYHNIGNRNKVPGKKINGGLSSQSGSFGRAKAFLGAGDIFGELSVIHNTRRVATFRVSEKEDAELYMIHRKDFKRCFYRKGPEYERYCELLDDVPMLNSLFRSQRWELARNTLGFQNFGANKVVIEQGKVREARIWYIIASGSAVMWREVTSSPIAPDSGCNSVRTACLDDEEDALFELKTEPGSQSVPVQRHRGRTSTQNSDRRATHFETIDFEPLELCRGDTFGERSLLMGEEKPEVSVRAGKDGLVCLCVQGEILEQLGLSSTDLDKITGCHVKEYLSNRRTSAFLRQQGATVCASNAINVDPDNLRTVAFLGRGAFGLVVLQEDKITYQMYALKRMSKGLIQERGAEKHIAKERDLMSLMTNPFIIRLYATWRDQQFVYMLTDFALGGNLDELRKSRPRIFTESSGSAAMFYTACVIEGIGYLHNLNIVFRDLKSENVLVDTSGYAKVSDFGFARYILGKTHTFCGTPEYIAPEIINSVSRAKGYSFSVDWWSLGCMTFELLCGHTPFDLMCIDNKGDIDWQALESVMRRGPDLYDLPDNVPLAKTFCRQLLNPDPSQRLGALGSQDLKNHSWFTQARCSFEDLKEKKMDVPHVPDAFIRRSAPPEMYDQDGVAVEVVVTEHVGKQIKNGGDRFQKKLTVEKARTLCQTLAKREYAASKESDEGEPWTQGFTFQKPVGDCDDANEEVMVTLKTHSCMEDRPGWVSYRCHSDLFAPVEEDCSSWDGAFELPPAVQIAKSQTETVALSKLAAEASPSEQSAPVRSRSEPLHMHCGSFA